MIEALKSNEVVDKVGGRFKLAVLIQKRLVDVTFGAPLLVERGNRTLMEAVIQEVLEGKITLEIDGGGQKPARRAAQAEETEEKDED